MSSNVFVQPGTGRRLVECSSNNMYRTLQTVQVTGFHIFLFHKVDLAVSYQVTAMLTSGNSNGNYARFFSLEYGDDGINWIIFNNSLGAKSVS